MNKATILMVATVFWYDKSREGKAPKQGGRVIIIFAILLLFVHELAHIMTTLFYGGRFEGLVYRRWFAIGVRVRVDGFTPNQIRHTLIAAPMAELTVTALACVGDPRLWLGWMGIEVLQLLVNWVSWGSFPNDGWRYRQLYRQMTRTPEGLS